MGGLPRQPARGSRVGVTEKKYVVSDKGGLTRMQRTKIAGCLMAVALAVIAGGTGAQSARRGNDFAARITPVPISPAERATITGSGAATAELDGRRLRVRGNFTGLQGAATTTELHLGVATGVRGPAIASLSATPAAAGEIDGEVELDNEQVAALREGRVYIQLSSAVAPDGNLWGWLLPAERRR